LFAGSTKSRYTKTTRDDASSPRISSQAFVDMMSEQMSRHVTTTLWLSSTTVTVSTHNIHAAPHASGKSPVMNTSRAETNPVPGWFESSTAAHSITYTMHIFTFLLRFWHHSTITQPRKRPTTK